MTYVPARNTDHVSIALAWAGARRQRHLRRRECGRLLGPPLIAGRSSSGPSSTWRGFSATKVGVEGARHIPPADPGSPRPTSSLRHRHQREPHPASRHCYQTDDDGRACGCCRNRLRILPVSSRRRDPTPYQPRSGLTPCRAMDHALVASTIVWLRLRDRPRRRFSQRRRSAVGAVSRRGEHRRLDADADVGARGRARHPRHRRAARPGLFDPARPSTPGARPALAVTIIVGGYAFSVGMTLASSAPAETRIRIGGGNLKSVVVFVFFSLIGASMTLRGSPGVWRSSSLDPVALLATAQTLPAFSAAAGMEAGRPRSSPQRLARRPARLALASCARATPRWLLG